MEPIHARVSQFYGISIYFYFGDHNPPHFHARYQGRDAVFSITILQLIEGQARPRVRRLVEEWARLHRPELLRAWTAVQEGRDAPPDPALGLDFPMQRDITECRPLPGFRVWLRFSDGVEGEADLSHLAGRGVFHAWSDRAFFERVAVDPDSGTIAWPGGIDLDPYVLYSQVTGKPIEGADAAA